MQLTQEYFDRALGNLIGKIVSLEDKMATKDDLAKLEARFDGKIGALESKMATKDDLKAQTKELKQYTTEAFETQQGWMEERFNELIVKYDVRERMEKLEKEFREFKLSRPVHA